jgi:purine-cytosine permease-like protein
MGLDIRWPIGLMFSLIGLLLTGFGAVNSASSMTKIDGQDININLIWGIVLLVFGILMVLFAYLGGKKSGPPPQP